ncbi:MAG: hypothetical protein P0Y56_03935 [Candidatus Andeanibacterium colombiense]|uniref:Uncharacterized protein n=1 Tax=Candidatus Andeanibacterium colombiense TaxID=3121345 RepID=A0AAJ5XAZ3_9SPHN|nr:MAG: hypothetical protein P0Y56_03935 [Sphingomonadaceae bacterium]
MSDRNSTTKLLPLPLPEDRAGRMVLVAMRRMAAHGIRDAHAAMVMLDLFGARFRRPLVLLRAFMVEFARASQRSIKVAPCCSLRMTEDEGKLLDALRFAASEPALAEDLLARLSGSPCVCEPLSAAAVFGRALEEWELARV